MEDCIMKKLFVFAAATIFVAALAVSCQEKEIEVNVSPNVKMVTMTCELPAPDTKVAIDIQGNKGKVKWEAGDKIHIHTGHIRDGEYTTVELSKDNISDDGLSATITFPELKLYDYAGNGFGDNYSKYYAAYPADALSNPESCYEKQYFGNSNALLMAASDKDGVFKFHNLCGLISFSGVDGYDSYVFSGNNNEVVGYSTYVVAIVEPRESFNYKHSKTTGDLTEISGKIAKGTNYVCLPNGAEFTGGFSIKFKKDGQFVKVLEANKEVTVARSSILALGDISGKLTNYSHQNQITNATNLGATETANCYVITSKGSYKIPAVKGNSNESAGTVAGVKVLWETYNNGDAVEAKSVIAAVDYDNSAVYFKTPDSLQPGNALIAALDKDENIIWSWHIWIPASEIGTIGDYNISKKYLMDRNLGAIVKTEPVANGIADLRSVGLYYEWGRKDPFVGYKWGPDDGAVEVGISGASGRNKAKSETQMTVAESIAAPTTFVAYKGDWLAGDHDNELWGNSGDKTIYDPCPAGYRVPLFDGSDNLWKKVNALDNFSASLEGRWWKLGDAVFPLAGCYDYSGGMDGLYNKSWVWSTLKNGSEDYAQAQYIYWNTDAWASEPGWGKRKACGASVRCVKIAGEVPAPEVPGVNGATAVVLDGSFSDWASADAITTTNSRIKEWKFGYDANNFYLYFKILKEKIVPEGEKDEYQWDNYIYVGIDTDNNAETGTRVGGGTDMETGGEAKVLIYPWRGLVSESSLSIINGLDEDGSIEHPVKTAVADAHPTVYGVFDGDYCYLEVGIPRSAIGDLASKIGVAPCMNYSSDGMSKAVLAIK